APRVLEVAPRGGDGAARWLEGAPCGHSGASRRDEVAPRATDGAARWLEVAPRARSGAAGGRNSDEAWGLMVKESGECRADDGHDVGVCAIDALHGARRGPGTAPRTNRTPARISSWTCVWKVSGAWCGARAGARRGACGARRGDGVARQVAVTPSPSTKHG